MRAAVYHEFKGPIIIEQVADPKPVPTGVVLSVKACGICRSDWHGWMGNDPDIKLPHVFGHELSERSLRSERTLRITSRQLIKLTLSLAE